MLTTIFAVLIVLGGLIFFHELGHFAVARALGMGVSTFSLGFGPKILKYQKGKTEYALSLIPLGGYVALVGETDEADLPEGFSTEESFALRPAWQRLLVVLAGPLANMLLAWLLCWISSVVWGVPTLLPEVGAIVENSPAAQADIRNGDRILRIDGQEIRSWDDLSKAISASNGQTMLLELQRKDQNGNIEELHKTLVAEKSTRKTIFGEEEVAWMIGVRASYLTIATPLPLGQAALASLEQTWKIIALTWQSLVKLVERVVPLDQVGGPIMIAQLVGEQAHQGLAGLLSLTALISVNLGVLNLLPVPVLDGGTILFCLLEIIFRRPINKKVQGYAMRFGLVFLVGLMLLATFNDIWRLIKS